jgi:flagellar motor component MotA
MFSEMNLVEKMGVLIVLALVGSFVGILLANLWYRERPKC